MFTPWASISEEIVTICVITGVPDNETFSYFLLYSSSPLPVFPYSYLLFSAKSLEILFLFLKSCFITFEDFSSETNSKVLSFMTYQEVLRTIIKKIHALIRENDSWARFINSNYNK